MFNKGWGWKEEKNLNQCKTLYNTQILKVWYLLLQFYLYNLLLLIIYQYGIDNI